MTKYNKDSFDLIEFQQRARVIADPKKLFALWEDVCRRYERGEIGKYELEEMKSVIWPNLEALAALKRQVDETETPTSSEPVSPDDEPQADSAPAANTDDDTRAI